MNELVVLGKSDVSTRRRTLAIAPAAIPIPQFDLVYVDAKVLDVAFSADRARSAINFQDLDSIDPHEARRQVASFPLSLELEARHHDQQKLTISAEPPSSYRDHSRAIKYCRSMSPVDVVELLQRWRQQKRGALVTRFRAVRIAGRVRRKEDTSNGSIVLSSLGRSRSSIKVATASEFVMSWDEALFRNPLHVIGLPTAVEGGAFALNAAAILF